MHRRWRWMRRLRRLRRLLARLRRKGAEEGELLRVSRRLDRLVLRLMRRYPVAPTQRVKRRPPAGGPD